MEVFNNTTKVVKDDLEKIIKPGSRISIAAACFSICAYQELKDQLEACDELRCYALFLHHRHLWLRKLPKNAGIFTFLV